MLEPMQGCLVLERERRARQTPDSEPQAVVMSAEVAAVAETLVTAGYRILLIAIIPTIDGDGNTMALVNAAMAALRILLRAHAASPLRPAGETHRARA